MAIRDTGISKTDQQALIEYLMQQVTPEWSVSEQAYQPFDIANETSALNIMQDRFSLMENPLMGILNGTFDYSLLDDVYDESGVGDAPDSTYTNLYGSNEKYAPMIDMLRRGNSANDAALEMFLGEKVARDPGFAVDEFSQADAENDPMFKSYVDVAKQLQPEIAANFSYQSSGGGKMVKSEMAELLESMGITSDRTEDGYFSDSIDQGRIDESRMLENTAKIIKDFESGWGGSGKVPGSALEQRPVNYTSPASAKEADDAAKKAALQAEITDVSFDAGELTFENLFGDPGKWVDNTLSGWINSQDGDNVSDEDRARIADIESEREANRYGFGAEQTPDSSSYDRTAAELEALGPFNGPRGGFPMGETRSGGLEKAIEDQYFESMGQRLPYDEIPEQLRARYEVDILKELNQTPFGQELRETRLPGTEEEELALIGRGPLGGPLSGPYTYDEYVDMMAQYGVQEEVTGGRATGRSQRGKGSIEDQYEGIPIKKVWDSSQLPSQAVPWQHRQSDGIINNKAKEQALLQQVMDEKSFKEKQKRDAPRIASRKAFEQKRSSLEDIDEYIRARKARVHGNSNAIEESLIERERRSGRSAQQDAVVRMLLNQPRG